MAQETAADLRREAEELGGASRSTASGLARKGETSSLSKGPEEDIENQDVHAEDSEQNLDEEASESEDQLESGQEGELEPKSEDQDDDSDDGQDDDQGDDQQDDQQQDDDQGGDEPGKKKKPEQQRKPEDRNRRGNPENAARRVERKQVDTKDQTIEDLTRKVQEYEQAESQREEARIEEEIKALATELKSDPAGLTKVLKFAERLAVRRVEQILKDRLPSKEVVDSIKQKGNSSKFDLEFASATVQDHLTQTYPRATAKQIGDAKNLLRRLSNGSKYPLDYFFMKNKKDFDAILDPRRRRGLESSRRAGTDVEVENRDTGSAKGIDDLDKSYREDQSGSGLRRERAGEKTF